MHPLGMEWNGLNGWHPLDGMDALHPLGAHVTVCRRVGEPQNHPRWTPQDQDDGRPETKESKPCRDPGAWNTFGASFITLLSSKYPTF